MEKDFYYIELYQEYKNLLTENQADVFNLYYLCDLSLGEIAEIKGVSKQGVSDNLSKTRELLDDYENKLGLLKKKGQLLEILNDDSLEDKLSKLTEIIGNL